MIADRQGRATAFQPAPGQAHEQPHAVPLLDQLPGVPKWFVGDQGYTSYAFREHMWAMDALPAILPQRHEVPVACPDWIENSRNQVERHWGSLKEWRAIATRYEKTADSFMGVLCLGAALDWLERQPTQRHDPAFPASRYQIVSGIINAVISLFFTKKCRSAYV